MFTQTKHKNLFSTSIAILTEGIQIIWKKDGLGGFFRGFNASLVTLSAEAALWWGCYSFFRDKLSQKYTSASLQGYKWSTVPLAGLLSVPISKL